MLSANFLYSERSAFVSNKLADCEIIASGHSPEGETTLAGVSTLKDEGCRMKIVTATRV